MILSNIVLTRRPRQHHHTLTVLQGLIALHHDAGTRLETLPNFNHAVEYKPGK